MIQKNALKAASFLLLGFLPLSSCNSDETDPSPPTEPLPPVIAVNPISDVECLRKISLVLTDQGPSGTDIAALESGTTLRDFAEQYLETAEFEQVVFNWYRGEFPTTLLTAITTDIEEPARIAAYIINEDQDYREIVTGTYTVEVDGTVTEVTDRPAAGVLSTTHNMSAFVGGFRRQWSGHMIATWSPYILEAIQLPPGFDGGDVEPQTLAENPGCRGCHVDEVVGVDNIANFALCYADDGSYIDGCEEVESTFLARTGSGLQDFGRILSESNEFKATTINFFFEKLTGRSIAFEEADFYAALAESFTANGYNAKLLLTDMVASGEFCSR